MTTEFVLSKMRHQYWHNFSSCYCSSKVVYSQLTQCFFLSLSVPKNFNGSNMLTKQELDSKCSKLRTLSVLHGLDYLCCSACS